MRKKESRRKNYKTQGYISSKTTYIDTSTGEVTYNYDPPHIGDTNFFKVWLPPLIDALYLGNSNTKVLAYMLDNMNKRNNILPITQKKIQKDLSMSYSTVNIALNNLKKINVITYVNSTYMINPDFIFQGYNTTRNTVINDFNRLNSNAPKASNSSIKNVTIKRVPIIADSTPTDTNIKPKNQKLIDKATEALRKINKK